MNERCRLTLRSFLRWVRGHQRFFESRGVRENGKTNCGACAQYGRTTLVHGRVHHPDSQVKSQGSNDYFLSSGDKIRFFFEKEVFTKEGDFIIPKERAVNKIGHALHALDPVFKEITHSLKIKDTAKALQINKPVVVQSMYIFKQPGIGGEVTPHQDATFLHTEPMQCITGFWFAVEDATEENGCLQFIPGSHRNEITRRLVRSLPTEYPKTKFLGQERDYLDEEFVKLPAIKGSLVIFDGRVVHKSNMNTSNRSRQAYVFHIMDSQDCMWSKDNWMQPSVALPFPAL
uniref:Phytanoyl-CoA dioxygenase domain-containing protein 1 n=1 Tax=Eptatretus burgeri TaxID=7764 RepID=A0A8C4QFT6_EPTBU